MSDDIVKRLRAPSEVTTGWCHIALHHDAAAEIERLRARVEVLETIRAAAQALIDYEDSDTYDPAGKGWEYWEENLRAALEAKP